MSSELRTQQEELDRLLPQLYGRYYQGVKELAKAREECRKHEYYCAERGIQECVKGHDENRMRRFAVSRTREKHFRQCTSHCTAYLPDGVENSHFTVRNTVDLSQMREYVECMQPCLSTAVDLLDSEILGVRKETQSMAQVFPREIGI